MAKRTIEDRFYAYMRLRKRRAASAEKKADKKDQKEKVSRYHKKKVDQHNVRDEFLNRVRFFPTEQNIRQLSRLIELPDVSPAHRQQAAQILLEWGQGKFKKAGRKIRTGLSAYEKGQKK